METIKETAADQFYNDAVNSHPKRGANKPDVHE